MAAGIERSAGLFYLPKPVGSPGAKLYFYQTTTSTPVDVFTDLDLSVAHTQPVEADANGVFAPIYIDGSTGDLRVGYYTAADVLIYQVDDYPASLGTTTSVDINDASNPLIQLVQSGAAANNKVWYIQVGSEQFKLSMVNDAFSAVSDFMVVDRLANTCSQINFTTQLLTLNSDQVQTGDCGVKVATETRNTTTTLTADTELTVSLIGSSYYVVDVNLYFYATTTAAMGIKVDVSSTGGAGAVLNGTAGPAIQHINGTGAVTGLNTFPATAPFTAATLSTNSLAVDSLQFSIPVVTAAAGTIFVRWAQNSSSANNLNLLRGSSIRATRLGAA